MRSQEPESAELTALLVAPDRELAAALLRALPAARVFQVLAELRSYPPRQTLEIRLRQYAPDVVLVDVATDRERAAELIRWVRAVQPPVEVVGLHPRKDSEALLAAVRAGASEFLHAPFEVEAQREAAARLRRMRRPEAAPQRQPGQLLAFASAKPGSGASTLASQTAFALARLSGRRVLLADLDRMSGTVSFYLRVGPNGAWSELLEECERGSAGRWADWVEQAHGVDVLPAPAVGCREVVDPARFHELAEHLRRTYDFAVLDLPTIFHRFSLMVLAEADQGFLVTTLDLAGLHLARKAVRMLAQLGFARERSQVLVNRTGSGDGLRLADLEKVIQSPAHASFPNDTFSLERILTLGQPLGSDSELGRAVESFAGRLAGVAAPESRRSRAGLGVLPVWLQSLSAAQRGSGS